MRTRLVVPLFLGWTLFVWITRVRNILGDDGLSTGGAAWRLGAAGFFVVLALAVAFARLRHSSSATVLLGVLVVWTAGWWSIRGVGILLDDHAVGFKIVHSILMVLSIGLAMWAWTRRDG